VVLLILAIAAAAAAAYLIAEAATVPARQQSVAIRRAATYGRLRLPSRQERESFRERVLQPLERKLARLVLRVNPRTSVEAVTAKLLAAGLARRISPTTFLAGKGVLGVSGLVLGALYGRPYAGGAGSILLGLAVAGFAFALPDMVLSRRARQRKEAVCVDLPDALDLLAVSVEAGLGFDAAIAKLNDHMEGPLADEFGLALNEMRIGETRAEALRRMCDRVPAPELQSFVRAVIQSEQLGMSMGRILRVQATDSRLRRQAAGEEKAMKAPIKMLFPTVFFIFPSMFIVVLGPTMLNLSKVL
jgi:tight adherence protein C